MTLSIKHSLSIYLLIAALQSIGQNKFSLEIFDSSFTLTKNIQEDKSDVGQHGIIFFEPKNKPIHNKQISKDFDKIEVLSFVNLANYKKQIIRDSNHLIKTWISNNSSDNISRIIEINSIYFIDSINGNERFKDTIIYSNYFVQLKDSAYNIWYETINKQGVTKYVIGKRQVFVAREIVLDTDILGIDVSADWEKLIKKYDFIQQVYLQ